MKRSIYFYNVETREAGERRDVTGLPPGEVLKRTVAMQEECEEPWVVRDSLDDGERRKAKRPPMIARTRGKKKADPKGPARLA